MFLLHYQDFYRFYDTDLSHAESKKQPNRLGCEKQGFESQSIKDWGDGFVAKIESDISPALNTLPLSVRHMQKGAINEAE